MAKFGTSDIGRQMAHTARPSWRNTAFSLLLALLPCIAAGDGYANVPSARIEAAFLRNFAHYLTWPDRVFENGQSPWRVCILGDDSFKEVVADSLQGRHERGRAFLVIAPATRAELTSCHLAYIAHQSPSARRAALAALSSLPVLTIGEAPEFLDEGGIIRFQVTDHVEFGIDLDHARAAALEVPTKVLEVAHEVVEDGVTRRRR